MNPVRACVILLLISIAGRQLMAESSTAPGQPRPGPEFAAVAQAVRRAMPSTRIDRITPAPIPGLVEVVAGRNILYADTSGRWLLVGHLYDLKHARDVTADRKAQLTRLRWADLPLAAAVHYGTGPLKLAIFSDPDCPWCRKLRMALQQAQGIEVWEIMFPITALHPQARDKAVALLCQISTVEEHAPAQTQTESSSAAPEAGKNTVMQTPADRAPTQACTERARQRIEEALAFGQAHGIQGTPTLIAPDGRVHSGYLPLERLRAWLQQDIHTTQEEKKE